MGSRDFNSSHCEPVIICNTISCIIKGANNIEWKTVTKDTVKKEILINRVIAEKNRKNFNTREAMAQNKIDVHDISRYMSLIIAASICFRADVLKSSYSFCMELMVEQSNFARPPL